MSGRLLMLGVDGLDWMLMNQWAAQGRMPVLHKLLAESRALLFREPNRLLPGSIWTDIATGASAAFHGFQNSEQLVPNSYRFDFVDSSHVAVAPFYKFLSDAGVRCAVVDFPVDYPLPAFNGIQVVDWGTEFKLWHFETRPKSLAAELVATYGEHPLTNYGHTRNSVPQLLALKHTLLRGLEMKRRLAVDLVRERKYEFVFLNFGELHKAGHFFWRFHDRKHPDFTDEEPQMVHSLREMYEAMDRAVGSVLEPLGSEDDLVLVTDRGMYADHRGDHLIDEILLKLELAIPRHQPPVRTSSVSWRRRLFSGRRVTRVLQFVGRRLLPHAVKEALSPLHRAAVGALPPWDWHRTKVFRLPTVGNSYLRINLAGREPLGCVSPGAEYEALLSQLAAQFHDLVIPETGERAVEDVYFPAKQLPGPKAAELPDVAIVWNASAPIIAVTSNAIGTISGQPDSDRSGNHRPDGFALFRGPSFAAGAGTHDGDARQIAPTILNRFGVELPEHCEMHAPAAIVKLSSQNRIA